MFLKRLEIQGFKSFANSTALEFLPFNNGRHSVTAIVGPNGAGKSNISDAIRWVMGEQSLKTIRGKKSEDVIFSGSDTKGQLGAAEVTMVLDNSPSSSPRDFDRASGRFMEDFPEITITRRLYRSGEAEYFINNNSVRLLDVHLLLAKSQFAEQSYTVVGQGTIDRLLTINAAERKDFLDEASGIKEYQIKRHHAELKLARTRENISQAENLMKEVEPRLRILSRQVKKLEKRQEVELKLREAEESYYVSLHTHNKTELESHQLKLKNIEEEYRVSFASLEQVQEELAELAHSATRQEIFAKLQSEHQALVNERNELERQLAIKEGRMQTEYSKAGAQNITWLKDKARELRLQKQGLLAELTAAEANADKSENLLMEKKQEAGELVEEKLRIQKQQAELERRLLEGHSEKNYWQMSGLSAIQAVLANKQKFGRVYGMLSELGEVDEASRLALEVAAGSYLTALVTGDDETARLAIEYLRTNHLGVAIFLPLNKVKPRFIPAEELAALKQEPGVVGLASELVKFDSEFAPAFNLALGSTLVVEDMQAARKIGIGRARMVTLKGDLLEKSGAIKGGYRHEKKNGVSFSRRVSFASDRIEEVQAMLGEIKNKLAETERKIEEARSAEQKWLMEREAANAKAKVIRDSAQNLERELARVEQELSINEASPEEYSALLLKLGGEKEDILKKIQTHSLNIQKSEEKLRRLNEEEEAKKQRIFKLQEAMQKTQNELNNILARRNEVNIAIAKSETKLETIRDEAAAELHEDISGIISRQPPVADLQKLPDLMNEIQKLKYQLSLIGGIDEEVVEEHKQTKEKYVFLSTQINDLNAAIEDLEKMIVELDEIMKKKRETAFKKIRKEFSRYFSVLFGGGKADITEVYGEAISEEPADEMSEDGPEFVETEKPKRKEKILVGIDIEVSPPGKKIKSINMLSGGERTLSSIALICAILSYNPSPFVVLDEVEAALDESNTRRFVEILAELSTRSQFIVITHNRVTMHAADALYGVVMMGDGISKLLSVQLEEAEKYGEKEVGKVDKVEKI